MEIKQACCILDALWHKGSNGHKKKNIICGFLRSSDEFELIFLKLSQAELKRFQAESSQARAFNFRVETELTINGKFLALVKNYNECRKVASSSPSRIEAHAGLFRWLMKGIFDPYVL